MRVLLDTNVVLDSLLDRPPWAVEANAILAAADQGKLTLSITALTIANIFYIGRRQVGRDKARQIVRDCLSHFDLLPVDQVTLREADRLAGSDFEDNIQAAAAHLAGVDFIVTRDAGGFTRSPTPFCSPSELLTKFPPPPSSDS